MEQKKLTEAQSLRGFIISTFVFLMIFAASAVPIPLYVDYQSTIGLTTADISNTMLAYLSGVSAVLLFAGRISDAMGRRNVTFLTLCLAMIGCELFLAANGAAMVLLARFVQGAASGFAMSATSALIIDCVGDKHLSWGSTVASCGPMFGIMLGSIGVGVLYGAVADMTVVYSVMMVILAVCFALLLFIPEPISRPASFRASVKVRLFVPRNCPLLFALVVGMYLATWLVSNFFQSFSSPIAYECFGARSALSGSIILACVMAPSVIGGPLVARFDPEKSLRVGILVLFAAVGALAVFVSLENQPAFIAACVVFSIASGVCAATSLRMLLLEVNVFQVSATLASVNLFAYIGSAIAGVAFGVLLEATSYTVVFAVQAFIVLVVGAFVFWYVRHIHRVEPSAHQSLRATNARLGQRREGQ